MLATPIAHLLMAKSPRAPPRRCNIYRPISSASACTTSGVVMIVDGPRVLVVAIAASAGGVGVGATAGAGVAVEGDPELENLGGILHEHA